MQNPSPFDVAADRLVRAMAVFGILPAIAVSVVVVFLAGPIWALVALVVVAAAWAGVVFVWARGAMGRVLTTIAATRGADGDHPRWENVVEGLGLRGGVQSSELWYLDQHAANACAVTQGDRVALVVTTGLLDALGPVEQEAVAANLLCRVRDGSARYATVTAGMLGPVLGKVDGADRLVAGGLGDQRSVHSDLAAVGMTRYPPGLARALSRMAEIGTEVPGAAAALAHLWLAPVVPDGAGVAPAVAATAQQPLALRVAVLAEL